MKPELQETLAFVAPKQWRSTRELHAKHTVSKVSRNAISNRLQELRAEKRVECRRTGREKFWRKLP